MSLTANDFFNIQRGIPSALRAGVLSDDPIFIMNAIIVGARKHEHDADFVAGVSRQVGNDMTMLNIRIGDAAQAALDVLGVQPYAGDSQTVKDFIRGLKAGMDHV